MQDFEEGQVSCLSGMGVGWFLEGGGLVTYSAVDSTGVRFE